MILKDNSHSILRKHGHQQGNKKGMKGKKRGKAPNLAEGILLSLSYLVGVTFLILTQVSQVAFVLVSIVYKTSRRDQIWTPPLLQVYQYHVVSCESSKPVF